MAAQYRCSACGTPAGQDDEGWPVSVCSCDAPIHGYMSSTVMGAGGIV